MNSFSVLLLSVSCSTLAASMGGTDLQGQPIRQHTKHNIVRSEAGSTAELEVRPLGSMVLQQASPHSLAPDSLLDITLDSASQDLNSAAPVTATQVPNNLAAFEVAGAGVAHFNGVYMPSTTPNTDAKACTSLTWDMTNAGGKHMLYDIGGAWNLDLSGSSPLYNGGDNNACAPEAAAWAGIGTGAAAAPTVTRAAAASYITTTKAPAAANATANATANGTAAAATAPTAAPTPQNYFVVTNAGIPGFNGVYYTTPLVVADQRCERTFAKDGPDNTEYTLAFGSPMWYFQSMIGGKMTRPYVAQDDGSCSPDLGTWKALTPAGGTVPAVARTNTATPTTTTTTTTRPTPPPNTTRIFTNTTTVAGAPTTTTVTAAPGATTTTVATQPMAPTEVKAHGSRGVSMLWLRLLTPLTLGFALARLSLGL